MIFSSSEFVSGVRDVSPMLLGIIPFGAISGAAAVGAGIPAEVALGMSVVVFAGAAQLAAVQLIAGGASAVVVLLTTTIINLRFVMYSASLAPQLERLSMRWKAPLAYLLTDQSYAVAVTRPEDDAGPKGKGLYLLGASLALWVVWQASTVLGILLGAYVPEGSSLEFVIPLTFLALLFPAITDRATGAAAGSAAVVAVLAGGLPLNLGLIVAAVAGVAVGLLLQKRTA
jgi:4-azaleucine resistance transporter AzlC